MKHCVLLSMLLALGCVHVYGAPVEVTMEQGSCTDPIALGAADQALTKLNRDRKEGYIFRLERLSDVHMTKHGENSLVFYLTLDVVETNCSVVSRKSWKECAARLEEYGSVYGQCKVAILINRVQRVVHLHKYDCVIRPVPSARLHRRCPDCLSQISSDSETVKQTVSKSLDKFNKESGLTKRFALLKISRASAGMAMSMHYDVEYVIQETTCARSSETHEHCPLMDCEFAHKGFCHGSLYDVPPAAPDAPDAPEVVEVTCEIYEPEAAEREKKLHIQGNDTDHSHGDTKAHDHDHDHDHAHSADQTHSHDHVHDHTQSHSHHDKTLKHANDSDHHHTHDHEGGSHRHAHDHSHDHGHDHDHVHAHHAKAHDHSGDSPHQHHDYKHPDGVHTHEHDHEFALDHDHKHAHLHEHEHHHHHHEHAHETTAHDHPMGSVRVLPAVDQPMIMPSFPDKPVGPVAGDSMAVGEEKITFLPFPTSTSAECPPPALEEGGSLVKQLFAEDPLFKPAA